MKFVISLFITVNAFASPIHLYYEEDSSEAIIYRDVLVKDYQIPEELILVKKTSSCELLRAKGKLDLCLKNNGDLFMVSVDREFINESLKVFQAP